MLDNHAPFPLAGSAALIDLDGSRALARINLVHDDGTRTVFIGNHFRASATKRVPLNDLIDGTPLTDAEVGELAKLDREMAGKARSTAKKLQRFNVLLDRQANAPVLEGLLARHRRSLERQGQAA
ncbi:MAG TPA: hypothetical protein VGO55_03065 [Allosphingosinicella sp.]|jgi:hypothetical protein|nr:hypothetical protein [Allosphingosinicella sp.]